MYSGITKNYYTKTVGHVFTKPVDIEGTTQKFFFPVNCFHRSSHFCRQAMRVHVVRKWSLRRRSGFVCWNVTRVSLWLLCNVHRSPDIRPCDFFLQEYVKNWVFVPLLPRDLADLKARINTAVKNIDAPTLTRVWQELEFRIDVRRVTRGAHIEHLQL